jgi:hypothetical protein
LTDAIVREGVVLKEGVVFLEEGINAYYCLGILCSDPNRLRSERKSGTDCASMARDTTDSHIFIGAHGRLDVYGQLQPRQSLSEISVESLLA